MFYAFGRRFDRVIRVDIKPELLAWARERAGLESDALAHRFPKLTAWQQGTAKDVSVLEREIDQLVRSTA